MNVYIPIPFTNANITISDSCLQIFPTLYMHPRGHFFTSPSNNLTQVMTIIICATGTDCQDNAPSISIFCHCIKLRCTGHIGSKGDTSTLCVNRIHSLCILLTGKFVRKSLDVVFHRSVCAQLPGCVTFTVEGKLCLFCFL